MTSDPEKSRAFYGQLFGWTAEEAGEEYGGYISFFKDGCPSRAACETMVSPVCLICGPCTWSRTTRRRRVLLAAMEVMKLGGLAAITDAGQAAIGAWQPGLHQGFGILGEPGAPTRWTTPIAALATIVNLGGSIIMPAEDTPFGRSPQAADPTGARFKLAGSSPRRAGC